MAASNRTKDAESTEDAVFPIHADDHGTEMTTIKVGRGKQAEEFKIHKSLLVKASPYFSGALTSDFKESNDSLIQLKGNDPIAFSVLYQYIYAGNVHAADFYSRGSIPDDLLWLRTFKLADATMVHPLLHIAYDRLRGEFSPNSRSVPSLGFINELFNEEYPQQDLKEYIAAHSAFWILTSSCGHWKDWVVLMDTIPHYGVAVARQITRRRSGDYRGSKVHPTEDPHFDKDTLFPPPIAQLNTLKINEEEDSKQEDDEEDADEVD